MEQQRQAIECGRCGETRLECLTEEEVRVISDGVGPAYRPCERCGKVTGWIEARSECAGVAETGLDLAPRRLASVQTSERLIPRGQERMATPSECDEVDAMLHRPHVF